MRSRCWPRAWRPRCSLETPGAQRATPQRVCQRPPCSRMRLPRSSGRERRARRPPTKKLVMWPCVLPCVALCRRVVVSCFLFVVSCVVVSCFLSLLFVAACGRLGWASAKLTQPHESPQAGAVLTAATALLSAFSGQGFEWGTKRAKRAAACFRAAAAAGTAVVVLHGASGASGGKLEAAAAMELVKAAQRAQEACAGDGNVECLDCLKRLAQVASP